MTKRNASICSARPTLIRTYKSIFDSDGKYHIHKWNVSKEAYCELEGDIFDNKAEADAYVEKLNSECHPIVMDTFIDTAKTEEEH